MNDELYQAPPWAPEKDLTWVETCFSVQSMQFMIDCLPMIRTLIARWPASPAIRVLDVGTGTGAGANLLATLYAGEFLGHPMVVDTIDIGGRYLERYAKAKFPRINYMVGDVADLPTDKPWDLVICSHTIEHIKDYLGFVATLQKRATHWVLFYAPWNERQRIPEHVNTIDRRFLKAVGATRWQIVNSPAWWESFKRRGEPRDTLRTLWDGLRFLRYRLRRSRSRCVVFVVPGRAQPK